MIVLLAGSLALVGCDRDDSVKVYQAPKDAPRPQSGSPATGPGMMSGTPGAMPPMGEMPMDSAHAGAAAGETPRWTLPEGWTEQAGGGAMRYATIRVSSANPELALTVIPLGPESGDLVANINRWEQQVGAAATPAGKVPEKVEPVKLAGGGEAKMVNVIGPSGQRMLGAIVARPGRVWFFKLLGPDAQVQPQAAAFKKFLESVRFGGES